MFTPLKFAKQLEEGIAGNINNFKRPLLLCDIYRVQRGTQDHPNPPHH